MPPRFAKTPVANRTMDGIVFDSKVEMTRWASLIQLEKAGQITDLKRQPRFSVEINNQHFCTYTADFIYKLASTAEEIIEDVKTTGTEKDAAYRLRKKAAELYHGVQIYAVDKNGTLLKKPRNRLTKPKKSVK